MPRASKPCGWWLLLPLLLWAVGLTFSHPAWAQTDSTLTGDAYWALVAETEATVAASSTPLSVEAETELAALADRWAAAREVALVDGTVIPLATSHLVALLRAPEPDLAGAAAELSALQEAHSAWPERIYQPAEARQLQTGLDEILARPAFQWEETEPTLLQRLWAWLLRTLFELLPTGQSNLLLNYALTALGAVLLLAVLLYAARSLLGNMTAAAEGKNTVPVAGTLTAEEALAQAQVLSREGDYRNAVRYLYLSTLLLLDERGVLRYDRSRTNREVLRSVAGRPEVARTLRGMVEIFDQTWYGYRPLDAETYAAYEAAVNDLKQVRGE